jgi:hypothetical protein
VVCHQAITNGFHWFTPVGQSEQQPVCAPCSTLSTKCFICRLPVKVNYRKLDDGRFLCERDAPAAVCDPAEVRQVFDETRRDMLRMFSGSGTLPTRNVRALMVDRNELDALHKAKRSAHDEQLTMGLTHTRMFGPGDFDHSVFLLSGLRRARLMAVCAHEWTHAWIQENVSADRKLEDSCVEGFCELVAYKLMTERNEEVEKKFILENRYTQGQVHAFIKAEAEQNFWRIIQWLKSGVGASLPTEGPASLALQRDDSPALSRAWLVQARTPVPDKLVLRGLSGSAQRRFALVNDATLEMGQRTRVRVGSSNVVVRCLDISDRSVVLQLNGSKEQVELFLRAD